MTVMLSELSSQLFEAKERRNELNEDMKDINDRIRELEHSIWQMMHDADLLKFTTPQGTIYISPQVVPRVVDWEQFYLYIEETKALHMLEKRPSRAAFRELYEAHKAVPGVEAVEFDEVRTRKS